MRLDPAALGGSVNRPRSPRRAAHRFYGVGRRYHSGNWPVLAPLPKTAAALNKPAIEFQFSSALVTTRNPMDKTSSN